MGGAGVPNTPPSWREKEHVEDETARWHYPIFPDRVREGQSQCDRRAPLDPRSTASGIHLAPWRTACKMQWIGIAGVGSEILSFGAPP